MGKIRNLLIVLGPPGSGKGTQSELLGKKFGYERIVMGDLVRAFIATDSPEARLARQRYDKGVPQPDELATKLLKEELRTNDVSHGVVLDTFPLSMGQANSLDEVIKELAIAQFRVIFLGVNKGEVVKRISSRKICETCRRNYLPSDRGYGENICRACGGKLMVRSDDDPQIAGGRFDEYEKRNKPIKKHYQDLGALIEVDGAQPIEKVHQEILLKLDLK